MLTIVCVRDSLRDKVGKTAKKEGSISLLVCSQDVRMSLLAAVSLLQRFALQYEKHNDSSTAAMLLLLELRVYIHNSRRAPQAQGSGCCISTLVH